MQVAKDFVVRILDWFSDYQEFDWKRHLFQEHSEQFLGDWAKRLKYFRFVKEHGGHGSSPDKIILSIRYDGQNDLISLFKSLGINFREFSEKPAQRETSKKYSRQEFMEFPSLVPESEWIEQPKHQAINDVEIFVWCSKEEIEFRISGTLENKWKITETEFRNAERLEPLFDNYAQRIIDPPEDTKYCLCPKYYPQYWAMG